MSLQAFSWRAFLFHYLRWFTPVALFVVLVGLLISHFHIQDLDNDDVVILGEGVFLLVYALGAWKLASEIEARLRAEEGLQQEKDVLAVANIHLGHEVAERKRVQAELESKNLELSLAANVFNTISEGVVITKPDGTIVSVNPAYCVMTGYQPEELIGQNPRILKSDRHGADFYGNLWECIGKDGHWQGEIWNRRKDGTNYLVRETITAIRNDQGELVDYVGVQTDITKAKHDEDIIRHQAYHDALTGLPNRTLALDRLRLNLAHANRYHKQLAVLFIDLDGFKGINDNFGHNVGDQVLMEMAKRLKGCVRESDTLARLGGDEFVAVLNELSGPHDATVVGNKILDALSVPYALPEGQEGRLSASIGVALYPTIKKDAAGLLAAADEAMYASKQKGKAAITFVAPG